MDTDDRSLWGRLSISKFKGAISRKVSLGYNSSFKESTEGCKLKLEC